jgi:hypothetical protein
MNTDLYILTRAHFSGDHCDVFGVFTSYTLAKEARYRLLKKIKQSDDNILIEITEISKDKINKLLSCECNFDSDDDNNYEF